MLSANICILCKGSRALCGQQNCPRLDTLNIVPKIKQELSEDFFGPSPSVFVGRVGYPKVNVGPLGATQYENIVDNPKTWMSMDYTKIIELRSMLLRSKTTKNIFSRDRFIGELQELALAEEPTEIEMNFNKKPSLHISFSDLVQPMGPSAYLKKMKVTENPKISHKVDSIANDELRAEESAIQLYNINLDVYKITTILSSGALGLVQKRKLVPTRWSITATDDIIAKYLIEQIKKYKSLDKFQVFSAQYLDNKFVTLFMPGKLEFENFEAWAPGTIWSTNLKQTEILQEYESFDGRTSYAEKQAGGYYAVRLVIVEFLQKLKRQARVINFREIYEGYVVPLGVWVVRETVRKAMRNNPAEFNSLHEALQFIDSKLRISLNEYTKQSTILRQKRLNDFS